VSGIQELPKHDDLFWPVIRAFWKLDGSADNDRLVETVIEILGLPDELTALPHKSGPQSEIGYRIAWVKSWLKWGGIVDNPSRGIWVLTERGRGATEEEVNDVRRRRSAEAAAKRKTKVEKASEDEAVEAPETEVAQRRG
jgi:restriction system protein